MNEFDQIFGIVPKGQQGIIDKNYGGDDDYKWLKQKYRKTKKRLNKALSKCKKGKKYKHKIKSLKKELKRERRRCKEYFEAISDFLKKITSDCIILPKDEYKKYLPDKKQDVIYMSTEDKND